MKIKSFLLAICLLLSVPTLAQGQGIEWTLDVSTSSRSNFKLFGSTASDNPVGGFTLNADRGAWNFTVIAVQGLGTQESGVGATANYYDLIIDRSWDDLGAEDRWSIWAGTEIFHAPAQLGG